MALGCRSSPLGAALHPFWAIAAAATDPVCRPAFGLGIGSSLIGRGAGGGWLYQADDQRLHLEFAAQAPLQPHFHLALHAHPIDFGGLASAGAAELIPAIFEHPADFALSPEGELAGIGAGDHTAQIRPWRRRHHPIGADHC